MLTDIAKFYVYAHFDSAGTCFYIGKGKQNRAFSSYKRNSYWQRIAKNNYTISILFDNLLESDAFKLEIELIAKYAPRANFTAGGAGGCTVNEQTKPIMKKKVSEKRKQWWAVKSKEEKAHILKNSRANIKKFWASFTPEQLSAEQKRRSNFRKLKKVICLNNNIIYDSAKEACEQLSIRYSSKIFAACSGDRPHYRGYRFKYI